MNWDGKILEPLKFASTMWPDVTFYKQQRDIIYSVVEDDETVVVAGNQLGKDFVAGFIALWFFLSRHPVRVVTTSADYAQLEAVLWGEIRRFIQTAKYPLEQEKGGPLVVNHLHVRKVVKDDKGGSMVDGLSYLVGRVAAKGEGMLGHHIADVGDGVPRTLFLADEASGLDDKSFQSAETWARRKLLIGNPWPTSNAFKRGVKEGSIYESTRVDTGRDQRDNGIHTCTQRDYREGDWTASGGGGNERSGEVRVGVSRRCYRRVIRIRAEDSPNVRVALPYVKRGLTPPDRIIVPGVLPYTEYRKRRETWDQVAQCIGLDAEFYEGAEVLLYPPTWLNRAESLYESRRLSTNHHSDGKAGRAMGVDPGEGGANTCWCVVDERGVLDLVSLRTPDTSVIVNHTLALMQKWQVRPERVCFDRGGGGKQIVDEMRSRWEQGLQGIRTVAFGESVTPEPRLGNPTPLTTRIENSEERYAYFNRRAQMYGALRELLDPSVKEEGFAIPSQRHGEQYQRLRQQLAVIPLTYDREGRLKLPPKNRGTGATRNTGEKTLHEMIGHSPDEADSLVLAVYAMQHRTGRVKVGVSG